MTQMPSMSCSCMQLWAAARPCTSSWMRTPALTSTPSMPPARQRCTTRAARATFRQQSSCCGTPGSLHPQAITGLPAAARHISIALQPSRRGTTWGRTSRSMDEYIAANLVGAWCSQARRRHRCRGLCRRLGGAHGSDARPPQAADGPTAGPGARHVCSSCQKLACCISGGQPAELPSSVRISAARSAGHAWQSPRAAGAQQNLLL